MCAQSKTTLLSKSVTLQDIADRCGVAKITVSYALRGGPRPVSTETRKRILATAQEMGYNPSAHHTARRLAMQRCGQSVLNNVIGLFFPDKFYRGNYFSAILHGILDTLLVKQFALLTSYAAPTADISSTDILPPVFDRGDVDGAILYASQSEAALVPKLRENIGFGNRPIVSLISPLPDCAAVLADDYAGSYAATTHLLELGHRYLLHFYPQDSCYTYDIRLAGIRKAYQDHHLDPDAYLRYLDYWDWTSTKENSTVVATLSAHPEITGIIARHDLVAMALCDALPQAGIRVPEDISIVGFDDIEAVSDRRDTPFLTTVHVPLEEIGQQAAGMVIKMVTENHAEQETIMLPTSLVVRGSTAPAARNLR